MRMSVIPACPTTPLASDSSLRTLEVPRAPARPEIVERLREIGGTEFACELLAQGALELFDFNALGASPQLHITAQTIQTRYERVLSDAQEVLREFGRRFFRQALALAGTDLLPLPHSQIVKRVSATHVSLVDPLTSGTHYPRFDCRSRVIELPVPVLEDNFVFSDYAHEGLHSLAGRTVAEICVRDCGKVLDRRYELQRHGLRFEAPTIEGEGREQFAWLDEGLVEYLVGAFLNDAELRENAGVAYAGEVDIIKSLIKPDGFYRVPLRTLTAAYFADYNPKAELGKRYPEWTELTRVFPTKHMQNISRLIERYGAVEAAMIVAQGNILRDTDRGS